MVIPSRYPLPNSLRVSEFGKKSCQREFPVHHGLYLIGKAHSLTLAAAIAEAIANIYLVLTDEQDDPRGGEADTYTSLSKFIMLLL